jgi:hypothetical protein
MHSHQELPRLRLYFTLDEDLCSLLEKTGLSYAAARSLSRLAVGLLRGLKKSVASNGRLYFPDLLYKDVLKHLKTLEKRFSDLSAPLFERIRSSWDHRRRRFVICDDYVIPRYAKKAFRAGIFRDPVKKNLASVIT